MIKSEYEGSSYLAKVQVDIGDSFNLRLHTFSYPLMCCKRATSATLNSHPACDSVIHTILHITSGSFSLKS